HANPRQPHCRDCNENWHGVKRILLRDIGEPQERHTAKLDCVLEYEKQCKEHRQRNEHRQTAREGAEWTHIVFLVHLHHFLLRPLSVSLVLLLNGLQIGLNELHLNVRTHGPLLDGPENEPLRNTVDDEYPAV